MNYKNFGKQCYYNFNNKLRMIIHDEYICGFVNKSSSCWYTLDISNYKLCTKTN